MLVIDTYLTIFVYLKKKIKFTISNRLSHERNGLMLTAKEIHSLGIRSIVGSILAVKLDHKSYFYVS